MSSERNGDQISAAEGDERNLDATPAQQIGQLLQEGRFCAATRLYSEMTGSDLIESKLAIDRLARKHNLVPLSGCLSHLALLVLLTSSVGWAMMNWFR